MTLEQTASSYTSHQQDAPDVKHDYNPNKKERKEKKKKKGNWGISLPMCNPNSKTVYPKSKHNPQTNPL